MSPPPPPPSPVPARPYRSLWPSPRRQPMSGPRRRRRTPDDGRLCPPPFRARPKNGFAAEDLKNVLDSNGRKCDPSRGTLTCYIGAVFRGLVGRGDSGSGSLDGLKLVENQLRKLQLWVAIFLNPSFFSRVI